MPWSNVLERSLRATDLADALEYLCGDVETTMRTIGALFRRWSRSEAPDQLRPA